MSTAGRGRDHSAGPEQDKKKTPGQTRNRAQGNRIVVGEPDGHVALATGGTTTIRGQTHFRWAGP